MNAGMKDCISTAESAKGMIDVVDKVDIAKTRDGIHSYDGAVYPW
jgi:hypothetical protein